MSRLAVPKSTELEATRRSYGTGSETMPIVLGLVQALDCFQRNAFVVERGISHYQTGNKRPPLRMNSRSAIPVASEGSALSALCAFTIARTAPAAACGFSSMNFSVVVKAGKLYQRAPGGPSPRHGDRDGVSRPPPAHRVRPACSIASIPTRPFHRSSTLVGGGTI